MQSLISFLIKNRIAFLLSIGILLGLSAYVIRFYSSWDTFDNEKNEYFNHIERKVKREIALCKKFNSEFTKHLENKSLLFSNLMKESRHPYYLFRNKKIIFWSDNEEVPSYNDLKKNDSKVNLVKIKNDYFISVSDSLCHQNLDFEIVSIIPIIKKYKTSETHSAFEYNTDIFGTAKPEIINLESSKSNENVNDEEGNFLFSIEINNAVPNIKHWNVKFSLILFALSFLSILLATHELLEYSIFEKTSPYKEEKKLGLWVLFIVTLRMILFYLEFPNVILETELFNPRFFAISQQIPSLGDFILYLFAALLIIFKLINYLNQKFKSETLKVFKIRVFIISFIFFLNHIYFFVWELLMSQLGNNYYWNLDINSGIQFTELKIWAFISVFLLSVLFLMFFNLKIKAFSVLSIKDTFLIWFFSFLPVAILYFLFETEISSVICYVSISLSAMLGVYLIQKFKIDIPQFLVFTYMVVTCAVLNSLFIHDVSTEKSLAERKKYVNDVLSENDLYAEFLIHEASEKIKNDGLVRSRFLNPMSSLELVESKIRKTYFPRYFDKYEIQIDLYDVIGEPKFKENNLTYHDLKRKFAKQQNKTEYRNLYLVKDQAAVSTSKKYINFIEIDKDGAIFGYLVLTFNRKRIVPHSVFPTLLIDKKFEKSKKRENYNYALFVNDTLSFSYGNYYYPPYLTSIFKTKNHSLGQNDWELTYNGYNHYVNQETKGTTVIVSSPNMSPYNIYSNFSFWFLSLLLFVALLYGIRLYVRHQKFSLISKIQFYVSLGFFFPLFLVGISSFGVFSNIYQEELKKDFISIVERTAISLSNHEEIFEQKMPKEYVQNIVTEISRNIEVDVNLFNSKGHLINSSEPLIFEKGLLSPFIYPKAYLSILESKKKSSIQNENIGNLNFFSAYAPVLSNKNGKLMGVVGIPFFESESELFSKITPVFISIINIFTFAFIVLTLVFLFLSRSLIYPIRLLKNRMLEVSFENNPKPIYWSSDDEIGTLVKTYNQMLIKLEESKKLLSIREKESAWREMAKQVAHEIKNPLTPMKLMVQYNLLKSQKEPENTAEIFKSTSEIVLKQIDTLSDIATSFSSFANMPIPKMDVYDFMNVVEDVCQLHMSTGEKTDLILNLKKDPYLTIGDEKLMFRILNNLLLNAVQSTENGTTPIVKFSLSREGDFLLFSIQDNGKGIPNEIQSKVFLPNFSTKYNGSGIGLAIAKNGVEFFGGKIWFETTIGQGTTFFVKLPMLKN
ncbi:MAG: ATP-binding protein [Cytophagales bacterium]